jgi:hypothetical protein
MLNQAQAVKNHRARLEFTQRLDRLEAGTAAAVYTNRA